MKTSKLTQSIIASLAMFLIAYLAISFIVNNYNFLKMGIEERTSIVMIGAALSFIAVGLVIYRSK